MKSQTFVLEIIENQNQNWQGRLEWIQGRQKQNFRSIMELLVLLDSAVSPESGESMRDTLGEKGSISKEVESYGMFKTESDGKIFS